MRLLSGLTVLLALASLVLTHLGARRPSLRTGVPGGICYALSVTCALVLGVDGEILLLGSLALLCAARPGRRGSHEL